MRSITIIAALCSAVCLASPTKPNSTHSIAKRQFADFSHINIIFHYFNNFKCGGRESLYKMVDGAPVNETALWANMTASAKETNETTPTGDEYKEVMAECVNTDHPFSAYYFKPKPKPWWNIFGKESNFYDPACAVLVYKEKDCKGEGWTPGPFKDTWQTTCNALWFDGQSVKTNCDEVRHAGRVQAFGLLPPRPNNKGLYNPATDRQSFMTVEEPPASMSWHPTEPWRPHPRTRTTSTSAATTLSTATSSA